MCNVYIYTYIYIHIYMCTYIHMYTYTHIYTYICRHVNIQIQTSLLCQPTLRARAATVHVLSGLCLRHAAWATRGAGRSVALARLTWDFPKIGVPCFGVLIIRILLFTVLF